MAEAQQGGFLARSGLDSFKIAGHKVPIALIAGGIALVGVIAVLRARQGAVSAGSPPASPAVLSDFGATAPDFRGSIASLQDQLTGLGTSLAAATAAPAPTPVQRLASLVPLPGQASGTQIPLALAPGGPVVGWAPSGGSVSLKGAPVATTYAGTALLAEPVDYLGGSFYVNSQNLGGI